ncbi:MAG: phenylalanine--tRNA ligase subunit beta [Patescibacteria group bacterium]|nr:phenylalanine--tRNA ligase subunit beta [Patescibacteria group bacterium]
MDIKILDSHLREHLETNAKPKELAKALSLTSASIERIEEYGQDMIYSVEVTTNRPDMLSVRGLAREAATVLPQFGFTAKLIPLKLKEPKLETKTKAPITVVNDETLVRRICAVVLEVEKKESPGYIQTRLEAAGIRSLNNVVDITNYAMLEMGHPCHAFDYDRLTTHNLIIRPSKKGEKIITLDKKEHTLMGGDIVADDGTGRIVDLLGIMGTANSVVTDSTKRILFFLDNNDPWRIRKTSMGLAIRTDAAALNEKGVDPELAMETLLRGIALYKEVANARVASEIIDIYPGKVKPATITLFSERISKLIGVEIPAKKSAEILESLGFIVKLNAGTLTVTAPSSREKDVTLAEDVVEEVARIYGYHNIPNKLPTFEHASYYHQEENPFYFEQKAKESLKYWGFTEVYTYSMVSSDLMNEPLKQAVTLRNPLDEEHIHMRTNLSRSFQTVLAENRGQEHMQIFELANVYLKQKKGLPKEILKLSFLLKGSINGKPISYFHAKGFLEQLAQEFNVQNLRFEEYLEGGFGAYVNVDDEQLGEIVVHDNYVTAEIDFEVFRKYANARKTYTPIPKYPPVVEDIAFVVEPSIKTGDIIDAIKQQSKLISSVSLLDQYENTRTFHIDYLDKTKNLTTEEVAAIREKIVTALSKHFHAKVK